MTNIVVDFNDLTKNRIIKLEDPETLQEGYVLNLLNNNFEDGQKLRWTTKQNGSNLEVTFLRTRELSNSYTKGVVTVSKKPNELGRYTVTSTGYEYDYGLKDWDQTGQDVEMLTKEELDAWGLKPGKTTESYFKNDNPVTKAEIKGFPMYDVYQKYGTITLANYYKYETDNVAIDDGDVVDSIIDYLNLGILDYSGETKGQTIKGSFMDNDIFGGSGNDKIYGVAGENYIFGGKGDDSLYSGKNTDYFDFNVGDASGKKGDIIYNADSNDEITFWDNNTAEEDWGNIHFQKDGNNLVLNHIKGDVYDKVTIDKFFTSANPGIEDLRVNGLSVENAELILSGKGKLEGTHHNDRISAIGASKITTGIGTDTIYTSTSADTITFDGEGAKDVEFVKYTGKDTLITTSDDVEANLWFDGDAQLSYAKKGNDFVISAANGDGLDPFTLKPRKASTDTITVKNYFDVNAEYRPDLSINGIAVANAATVDITTADKFPDGSKAYVGTWLNNNFTDNGKGSYLAVSLYATANDTYNVNLTKNSQAMIYDFGGVDTFAFTSDGTKSRLFFNVKNGAIDAENLILFDDSYLNEKSVKSIFKNAMNNKEPKGYVSVVEYFSDANKKIETFVDGNTNIAMDTWIDTVRANAAAWLTANGYESSVDAIAAAIQDKNVDITGLIQAYNVSYNQVNV